MVGTVVIKRVFNNNVAMVTSDDGSELIVIGRGLCFGRHAGDAIDEASIEKTYALQKGTSQDSRTIDRLAHLLESIPTVNLMIAEDIVQMLRRELNVDINDKILIALADHISLALERERKGVSCENPLLLEIQQFYRKEYALAGRALQIIKEYMGIQMSEEEQGFITLHIVNATMPQRSDRLIVSVQLVRDVLAIVSKRYATTLDDTSLPYERFVRHLQFFAQRALEQRIIEKIELAGGQIVCCAPVSVDLFELLGRQRRLFRQPCGAFLRRHGKLLLFLLIDEVSISFNFKKSIVRHRKRGKILKYIKISVTLFCNLHEFKR